MTRTQNYLTVTLSQAEVNLLRNAMETWEPFHSPLRTEEKRLCAKILGKINTALEAKLSLKPSPFPETGA